MAFSGGEEAVGAGYGSRGEELHIFRSACYRNLLLVRKLFLIRSRDRIPDPRPPGAPRDLGEISIWFFTQHGTYLTVINYASRYRGEIETR